MRSFRRFLAGVLAFAMFFTGADFGAFDFSPLIAHAQEEVTDVYDAVASYVRLESESDFDTYKHLLHLDKDGDYYQDTGLRDSTSNLPETLSHKLEFDNNGAPEANGTSFGVIYSFHQKDIDAAAQFKSGKWLTDTVYDSQYGTPTTESLFMTAGGTQWIVNCEYRYLTMDYVRRYKFNANGDNYRYYKISPNNINNELFSSEVEYQHTRSFDTHNNPDNINYINTTNTWDRLDYSWSPLSGNSGNIAYTWASTGEGAAGAHGVKVTEVNQDTWAGVDIRANRPVGSDSGAATEMVQPAVAECILYKRAILSALEDLNDVFMSADDNYRADFGAVNTDDSESPDYEPYNIKPDQAGWMFTYESLLRKSANSYTTRSGVNEGDNWLFEGNGFAINPRKEGTSYFSMHPTCVSYWLDQSGLYLHDAMYPSVQSNYMTPYTLGAVCDYAGLNPAEVLVRQLNGCYASQRLVELGQNYSDISPIALSMLSGDPGTSVLLTTANSISVGSSRERQIAPLTSSLFYLNDDFAPGVKTAIKEYHSSSNIPYKYMYEFLIGDDYIDDGINATGDDGVVSGFKTTYGFNGFNARDMAAFSAPHYVQQSEAYKPIADRKMSSDIFGQGTTDTDLIWELSVGDVYGSAASGSVFTYDKSHMGGTTGFTGTGNFSATLCDYYRTLYNLYFMVAPFLVEDDFTDYPFLLEIPGVNIEAAYYDEDIALKCAAMYFGSGTNIYYSGADNKCFSFTLASFPIGGDLDGAMENQDSAIEDSMYNKYVDSGTLYTQLTDTAGADLTDWSQKYLSRNCNPGDMTWQTYSFLCLFSPYILTEYNYTVQYTISRDTSSDKKLHETFDWTRYDPVRNHHTYTSDSGSAEWYNAPSDAKHHLVCHSAGNHSTECAWVPTGCAGVYEDLIKCSVCGSTGYIACTCTSCSLNDSGVHGKNWASAVDCDDSCPDDDPATPDVNEACSGNHGYECDYPGCSGTSSTCWHACTVCAGTNKLLCPGCWHTYIDANGDGVSDDYTRPSNVAYTTANRAAWTPDVPCLDASDTSGYTDYCEYDECSGHVWEAVVGNKYLRCEPVHLYNEDYRTADGNLHVVNPSDVYTCGTYGCTNCVRCARYITYSETWNIHYAVNRALEVYDDPLDDPNSSAGWDPTYTTCWDSYNKTMRANFGITQRFNNVKYLDITSYTVWCMNHSRSKGLESILAVPIPTDITSEVVQALGLVVYNNENDCADTNQIIDGRVVSTSGGVLRDYVTNAQGGMNRVANSFYPLSQGNVDGEINMVNGWAVEHGDVNSYQLLASIVGATDVQFQYYNRVGDVPYMYVTDSDGPTAVNKRMYAYKVNYGDPDYLKFSYNSNSQGGRSSTTFYAFVSQAVANTLFCKDTPNFDMVSAAEQVKEDAILAYHSNLPATDHRNAIINEAVTDGVVTNFTNKDMYTSSGVTTDLLEVTYCTPYSNSILIQGDYLSVQNADGTYTTVVGSMHDTWDDRDENNIWPTNDFLSSDSFAFDPLYCGGRFSLAAHNAIGNRFLSSSGWIKACYSEIFTRVDPETLWTNIFNNTNNTHISNCVFVHTFVGAINDYRATVFDSASVQADDLVGGGSGTYNLSYQGSANRLRGYLNSGHDVWRTKHELYRYSFTGSDIYNTFGMPSDRRLKDVTISPPYTDFGDTASNQWTVLTSDAPCADITLGITQSEFKDGFDILYIINCNDTADSDYKRLGESTAPVVSTSSLENRSKALSYVGYGADPTAGIGTKDISVDGSNDTQIGYLSGDTTLFKPNYTFVSDYTKNATTSGLTSLRDKAGNSFNSGYDPVEYNHIDTQLPKSFSRFNARLKSNLSPLFYWGNDGETVAVSTVESAFDNTMFTQLYPHVEGLNVKRTLPNGEYMTGDTDIIYTVAHSSSGVTDNKEVHAGYNRGRSTTDASKNTTNNIIVYNPVSTQTATVVKLSEHTPDGTNRGIDDKYLSEGIATVSRNVITVNRYATALNQTGSELIVTNTSYVEGKPSTVTVESKSLKPSSDVTTKAYIASDYIDTAVNNSIVDIVTESTFSVTEDAYYNLAFRADSAEYYGRMYARSGDVFFKSDNGILYKPAFNASLNYSDLATAYVNGTSDETPEDTTTRVPVKPNSTYTVNVTDTSGANTVIELSKGAALQLCLPIQNAAGVAQSADTLTVNVLTSSGSVNVVSGTSYYDNSAHYKCWYIIANDNTTISGISISGPVGNSNVCDDYIVYDDNLQMLSVLPTLVGTVSAGSIQYITTKDSLSGNFVNTEQTVYVNNQILEISGESGISGTVNFQGVYACIQKDGSIYSWQLKDAVLVEPHKVEHANWRYYVIGNEWSLSSGRCITKADLEDTNGVLYNTNTWLQAPNGYYITVASMDSLAGITAMDGIHATASNLVAIETGSGTLLSVYKDTDFARNVKLYQSLAVNANGELYGVGEGVSATELGYAYNSGDTCIGRTLTFNNVTMNSEHYLPLSFGNTSNWIHKPMSAGLGALSDCAYDYVWFCFDDGITGRYSVTSLDGYAYDVRQSTNLAHRYSEDHVNWYKDWDKTTKVITSYDTEAVNSPVPTSMLYLDDEFTIYWNNLADVAGNGGSDSSYYAGNSTLGRGWNNISDSYEGVHPDVISALDNDAEYTDTTKWIYRKYVTFSVDMYCFTEGASGCILKSIEDCENDPNVIWDKQVDPTTPAYSDDGTPNQVVFIPAGVEVPLGYYNADSMLSDDGCKFTDYGNNDGTTKDPNGTLYTYHFWTPLSDGESYDEVVVNYRVESINGVGYNGNDNVGTVTVNTAGGETSVSDGYFTTSGQFVSQPEQLMRLNFARVLSTMKDDWGEDTLYAYNPSIVNNEYVITGIEWPALTTHIEGNVRKNPIVEKLEDSVGNGLRYGSSFKTNTLSIAGRVGGLTVVDSGDPRWQDTFKVGGNSYAIAPIVKAVKKYANVGYKQSNVEGAQNLFLQDVIDVRGRYVLNLPANYSTYMSGLNIESTDKLNTYNTQLFKAAANVDALPLNREQNIHADSLKLEGVKLGYELLCSLDTIGNYFGSVSKRTNDVNELPSNNNGDYGQTKIQIRPVYFGVKADADGKPTGEVDLVDVYMRKGNDYVLINAGSPFYGQSQANVHASSPDPYADGYIYQSPYYAEALFTSDYTATIPTNTHTADSNNDNVLDITDVENKEGLDANMLRRMVTDEEANATLRASDIKAYQLPVDLDGDGALDSKSLVTTSFIDKYGLNADVAEIGAIAVDSEYSYGNSQMMYLREPNRTLVGGASTALGYDDQCIKNPGETRSFITDNAELYGQKWYFGLQLPTNAVFVKHGTSRVTGNTSEYRYVICALEVYAVGEKWVLRYESPLCQSSITIKDWEFAVDKWNKIQKTNPYLLPVTYFDLSDDASSDFDTRGSY